MLAWQTASMSVIAASAGDPIGEAAWSTDACCLRRSDGVCRQILVPPSAPVTAIELYRAYSQTLTAGRANFMLMSADGAGDGGRLTVFDGVEDLAGDTAEYLVSGYATEGDIDIATGNGERAAAHVRYVVWIDAKNLVREMQIVASGTFPKESSAPPVPSFADLSSLPDIPESLPSDPMSPTSKR